MSKENLGNFVPGGLICFPSSFSDKDEDDEGGELGKWDCFIPWYVKEEVVLAEDQEPMLLVRLVG